MNGWVVSSEKHGSVNAKMRTRKGRYKDRKCSDADKIDFILVSGSAT